MYLIFNSWKTKLISKNIQYFIDVDLEFDS